jgi:hypothetical protein
LLVTKIMQTQGFVTSIGSIPDEDLAYAYCIDETGYCLSVSRYPQDELIEVMVYDQLNHKTCEVSVELSMNQLVLGISPAAAAHLHGITEYTVQFAISDDDLHDLDAALSVIFADGNRGEYTRQL